MRGGGSKAVWNFSENSSVLEGIHHDKIIVKTRMIAVEIEFDLNPLTLTSLVQHISQTLDPHHHHLGYWLSIIIELSNEAKPDKCRSLDDNDMSYELIINQTNRTARMEIVFIADFQIEVCFIHGLHSSWIGQ